MRSVCIALDKLQSKENAFTGILWPTVAMTVRKLRRLENSNTVAVCLQLVKILIQSLKERFQKVLSNSDYAIATSLHP